MEQINRQRTNFFIVDNCIIQSYLRDGVISVYDFALYCALMSMADTNAQAYPSVPTLARLTGISERQVILSKKRLVACGLLVCTERKTASGDADTTLYTLVSPQTGVVHTVQEVVHTVQEGGAYCAGGVVHHVHGNKTHGNKTHLKRQIHGGSDEPPDLVPEKPLPKKLPKNWETHWQDFRAQYPRRAGDLNVRRGRELYQRILREGVEPVQILRSLQAYRQFCEAQRIIGTPLVQQIPTWLNRRAWETNEDYGMSDSAAERERVLAEARRLSEGNL